MPDTGESERPYSKGSRSSVGATVASQPLGPVPPARLVLVQRRLTERFVAKQLDYSESYTYAVLAGRRTPSRAFVRDLSRLLDVPAQMLFPSVSPVSLRGALPVRHGSRSR